MTPRNKRHAALAWLGACVGAGVAALWLRFNAAPGARGGLFPHDLVFYFLPQIDAVGQRLAAGELPFWNPYPCAGLPLAASMQVAVFYPLTWFSAAMSAEHFLAFYVLVHLAIGSLGAGLLFRALGVPASFAAAFGVVFGFACLIGQSFWPPEVAVIAWWPWLMLCAERILSGRDAGTAVRERRLGTGRGGGWWLGLVLTTALQLLAGFPQFALYGLFLLAPFVVLRTVQRARHAGPAGTKQALGALAGIVLALVLGAGVAAVQLAPSFVLLSASDRAETFTEREVHYLNALGQPRLAQVMANAVSPSPRLMTFELGRGAGYLGTGTLILAAVALFVRRREALVWALALGGVSFLLLSDGYLGFGRELYQLYTLLPGAAWFRAPERLLFPAFACVLALGALGASAVDRAVASGRAGVERARTEGAAGRRQRIEVALVALLAAGVVAIAGVRLGEDTAWRAAAVLVWVLAGVLLGELSGDLSGEPAAGRAARRGMLRIGWRVAGAFLLILDVASATGSHGSLRDLPVAAARTVRVGPHAMLDAEAVGALREELGLDRVEFVSTPSRRRIRPLMGVGSAGALHRLACYETLLPGQWPALSQRLGGSEFRSAQLANVDPEQAPLVYDVASVRAIVVASATERLSSPPPVEIRDNPDAVPRAYLVNRFEVTEDQVALDRLVQGDFDPLRTVLLSADPGLRSSGEPTLAIPAEIEHYAPERVEISVAAPSPAVLILTDTDAPGWSATVDGNPVAIHRANGLFRAVAVPGGEHSVVFTYVPAGLPLGAAISGASVLVMVLVSFRMRSEKV